MAGDPSVVADLDLRPERRDQIVLRLRAGMAAVVLGSEVGLRGSLAAGTADPYSDVDICWVVPDGAFPAAIELVAAALRPQAAVSSLRIDPDFARSARRRLVFVRLAGLPLFWRVDLDIRAASVAADDSYDVANPGARSSAGWSRPASAIENAVSAIKAAARHQLSLADEELTRGYQRIGRRPDRAADLSGRINALADSCAALDRELTGIAAEVHQVTDVLVPSGV